MKKEEKEEKFLKRSELATRWRVSTETIKRRQRSGVLHPIRLSQRLLLYRLSEVEALERASGTITEPLQNVDDAEPRAVARYEVGARR